MYACERCSSHWFRARIAVVTPAVTASPGFTCRRCRNSGRLCRAHDALWKLPAPVLSAIELVAVEPAVGDQSMSSCDLLFTARPALLYLVTTRRKWVRTVLSEM